MKLNSIHRDLFDAAKCGSDVRVNASNGKPISRNEIITTGRLVACEYIGSNLNKRPNNADKYVTRLNGMDYATVQRAHSDAKFLFCAAQAYKMVGKEAPTIEEAKRDLSLSTDRTFLATMAAIDRDVLNPIAFRVFDDVSAGGLMRWEAISFGSTAEITVTSNDVFLFEDSSWGSSRSTSKNYLYAKTITLNPKNYSCNATIKWYQDVVNGDAGRYYAAIMNGMWNKIYAKFIQALNNAAADPTLIPAGLTADTYTTLNWANLTKKVASANGVRRDNLIAYGDITALMNVLPIDGQGGAIVGLQYGLGEEWFKQGYIQNVGGVDMVEAQPVIVPGTQNSTLTEISTENSIYVVAKGAGYAPMYGAYFEGSPITLTATPSETADFAIDINVTATFDIKPVFASKVGVMTSVYPNT